MSLQNGLLFTQKSFIKILFLVYVSTVLSSCVKVSNSSLHIPQDVFFASRANILRTTYQVPNWKDILRQEFSIDVEADSTPKTNFLASGKAYIFGNMTQNDENYVAFAINIFNQKSLERFVTKLNPDLTLKSYKHFKYLVKNKSLLAWSHNVLVLIDAPQAANESYLAKHLEKIADVKKGESLIKNNENFKQALRNNNDVALWINAQELRHSPLMQHFLLNNSLEKSYLHLQANFDEGVISTKTQFFANEALKENYGQLFSKNINLPLLSHLPIQKPVALASFSMNSDYMSKCLIDLNLLEKASNLATSTTFTLEHYLKMLSGDVVFALKDLQVTKKEEKSPAILQSSHSQHKKVVSDFVLGFGLRDKTAFDELVALMEETGMLTNYENYYHFFGEIYVMPTDSMVYLTKNMHIKDEFLKGLVIDQPELIEKAKENCFLFYANEAITQKTIKGKTMVKEIARNLLGNENLRLNQSYFTLASQGGKNSGAESLILLKDEMENSLLAMLEVLKEIISQTKIRLDPNYYKPE